ncbi:uncharacterized protein KGF55_004212 [Candida pseudojiufengensis]|uniref:uncharacterized protein n=1 Tax=Candida pseudojiufengensis TaxID=497109 RepID=UPI002225333C|nr:uncharacterized protein KGF55_004212 [Candida pseudojiufengensis]KAI5960945.1 hypothetical protein KGF55_004212 [Candida pseudojiufengensis]
MTSEEHKNEEKPIVTTTNNTNSTDSTTDEPKNYSAETKEILNKDELSQQDLNQIENIAKGVLNPNNENPQMNEYINSTMSYIGNVLQKMQNTNDKDATAKEIADDLTKKFENWANSKKQEIEESKTKPAEDPSPSKVESDSNSSSVNEKTSDDVSKK